MKLEDTALAVVPTDSRRYKIMPVIITGVMESLKKVTVNGETERKAEKVYQVESLDGLYEAEVSSENIFAQDEKELAEERRNELLGIDEKKIEERKLKEAHAELTTLKRELKRDKKDYKWSDEIENTLAHLIKDGYITIEVSEASKLLDRTHSRGIWDFDPFDSWEENRKNMNKRLERLMRF